MITEVPLTPAIIREFHTWMSGDDFSCPACTRHIMKGGRKNGNIKLPELSIGTLQDEQYVIGEWEERYSDDLKIRDGNLTEVEKDALLKKYDDNNRLFGWTAEEILKIASRS